MWNVLNMAEIVNLISLKSVLLTCRLFKYIKRCHGMQRYNQISRYWWKIFKIICLFYFEFLFQAVFS